MGIRRRSAYEFLIIIAIVFLTAALAIGLYIGRNKVSKGKLLVVELSSLRTSVTLYKTINRENPSSLEALVVETYDSGDGDMRSFADKLHKNDDGEIVDPFGNPYLYDSKTGWVSSSTERYETW